MADHIVNKTEFNDRADGIYSTGSGDINLFVSNLGEAIKILKQVIPEEQTSAIDRLIDALRQLSRQQKVVSEVKKVHNMLHRLETYLAMLDGTVKMQQKSINFPMIEESWRIAVRPQMMDLEYFASTEMAFLNEPHLVMNSQSISGPYWVVNLIALQTDFENSLKEKNFRAVLELSRNLLDICRENLFRVDRQLLEAINELNHYSDLILKVLDK